MVTIPDSKWHEGDTDYYTTKDIQSIIHLEHYPKLHDRLVFPAPPQSKFQPLPSSNKDHRNYDATIVLNYLFSQIIHTKLTQQYGPYDIDHIKWSLSKHNFYGS